MTTNLEYISGTSIAAFLDCPQRWAYAWIANRVPRVTPTPFTVGKMIHAAFELHFKDGAPLDQALRTQLPEDDVFLSEHEAKAVREVNNLVEPLAHWADAYPIDETLETEEPFEFPIEGTDGVQFRGRPDRVVRMGNHVFHMQHKTTGAGTDLGLFISNARRSLHELLYGWWLEQKYCDPNYPMPAMTKEDMRPGQVRFLTYGGTIYNIVRKLQYKSRAKATPGKVLHDPQEFFLQTLIGIDPKLQRQALAELPVLVEDMQRTAERYLSGRPVPSNRRLDGGYYGSRQDLYTRVILGEISLQDDKYFMDREETYDDRKQ